MATQKITLNELRSVIRQIIKEETDKIFKHASITIKEPRNGTIVWAEDYTYHDDEDLAEYIMNKKKLWKHHEVEYEELGINPYIKAGTK